MGLCILFLFLSFTLSTGLLVNNVDTGFMAHMEEQMRLMNASIQNNKQEIQSCRQEIQTLKSRVNKLPNDNVTVAFFAEIGKEVINPSVGSGVVFDVVHLNEGNGYDNIHGIFRAPVEGIYHFTIELTATPTSGSHDLHVFLMKSSTTIGYVYLTPFDNNVRKRSATATVHLSKNEDIWAKVDVSKGSNTIYGGYYHSIFSGFLIKAIR